MATEEQKKQLDKLIEYSLADGKLTKKEVEVLKKKAWELGIDEDEFEVELKALEYKAKNAKKARKKDSRSNFFKSLSSFWGRRSRIGKMGIGCLTPIIILFIAAGIEQIFLPNYDKKINQALNEYNFEEARRYAAKAGDVKYYRKIITSENTYYLNNNALSKAKANLSEYQFNNTFSQISFYDEKDNYNKEVQWYNNRLKEICLYLAKNEKLNEALKLVNTKYRGIAKRNEKELGYTNSSYNLDYSNREKFKKKLRENY